MLDRIKYQPRLGHIGSTAQYRPGLHLQPHVLTTDRDRLLSPFGREVRAVKPLAVPCISHPLPELISLCFGVSRKRSLPEPRGQSAKDTQDPRCHGGVENRAACLYHRFLSVLGVCRVCNHEIIPVGIHNTNMVARAAADFVDEVPKLPLKMAAQLRCDSGAVGINVFWMVLQLSIKRGQITRCRRVLGCQPEGPEIRI